MAATTTNGATPALVTAATWGNAETYGLVSALQNASGATPRTEAPTPGRCFKINSPFAHTRPATPPLPRTPQPRRQRLLLRRGV